MADSKEKAAGTEEKPKPAPAFKFDNKMADKPIVGPDGHPILTQEDIDARV